jgi:hypothetical protein
LKPAKKPFVISNIYPTIEEKSKGFSSFFYGSGGGGLMSSVISTIHPNPHLKKNNSIIRCCTSHLNFTVYYLMSNK